MLLQCKASRGQVKTAASKVLFNSCNSTNSNTVKQKIKRNENNCIYFQNLSSDPTVFDPMKKFVIQKLTEKSFSKVHKRRP